MIDNGRYSHSILNVYRKTLQSVYVGNVINVTKCEQCKTHENIRKIEYS